MQKQKQQSRSAAPWRRASNQLKSEHLTAKLAHLALKNIFIVQSKRCRLTPESDLLVMKVCSLLVAASVTLFGHLSS